MPQSAHTSPLTTVSRSPQASRPATGLELMTRVVALICTALTLLIFVRPVIAPTIVLAQTAPPATGSNQPRQPASTDPVPVAASAVLIDDGQPIDKGLIWHVFSEPADANAKPRLVTESKDATPRFRLEPGDYLINAAFGRANTTRRVKVVAGKPMTERFVLNAGGLKINAVLPGNEAVIAQVTTYDVFSAERDQTGNRIRIIANAHPGRIVRLNAGLYQVVSTYGDANARVLAEISVEPGKLTEATLTHAAARISFRLVSRTGADALPDVAWTIQNDQGEIVKESVGAVPIHVLAAGRYVVIARRQGRGYRAEFDAKAGDNAAVEVVAQ